MQLYAVGINHQSAPVKVRERVAFNGETMPEALRNLVQTGPVSEAAILSTCNRTEIYCSTNDPQYATGWLADYHKLERDALKPGMTLDGPALIVEDGTTTVVPSGFTARINAVGQIVLEDRA